MNFNLFKCHIKINAVGLLLSKSETYIYIHKYSKVNLHYITLHDKFMHTDIIFAYVFFSGTIIMSSQK